MSAPFSSDGAAAVGGAAAGGGAVEDGDWSSPAGDGAAGAGWIAVGSAGDEDGGAAVSAAPAVRARRTARAAAATLVAASDRIIRTSVRRDSAG
jgi:hypothetical protein